MMNKARREEIAKTKHKRRCMAMQINPKEHYSFKSCTKPCSCSVCSPNKFNRKIKHKNNMPA